MQAKEARKFELTMGTLPMEPIGLELWFVCAYSAALPPELHALLRRSRSDFSNEVAGPIADSEAIFSSALARMSRMVSPIDVD